MSLAKYPPETARILHRDIFWFFLKEEEFVSKTINDSKIDLKKFAASKARQLAKKMESSKSTMCHIKLVSSDRQAAQVNLIRHQRTDCPPSKGKWKQQSFKSRSKSHKRYSSEYNHNVPPYKKKFDPNQAHQRKDRCSKWGDSKHIEGFRCPAGKFQCKTCNKYGHFTSLCYKNKVSFKSRSPKVHKLQTGVVYMQEDSTCFCFQVKIQCTQANTRLDTCTDVNVMPASVYKLVSPGSWLQEACNQ